MASSRFEIEEESLITSVQDRPCIWDSREVTYADRGHKNKAWDEVCEIVYENWSTLPQTQKTNKLKQVQTRWRSLKDCYQRELRNVKECERSGSSPQKENNVYFDQLDFLCPVIESRSTSGNLNPSTSQEHEHDSSDALQEPAIEHVGESSSEAPNMSTIPSRRGQQQDDTYPLAGQLSSLLDERRLLVEDGNYHFAMYVFSVLKNMPKPKVSACRNDIWKTLQKYSDGTDSQEPQLSQTLHTNTMAPTGISSSGPIPYFPAQPHIYQPTYTSVPNTQIQYQQMNPPKQAPPYQTYAPSYSSPQFPNQMPHFQPHYSGQIPNNMQATTNPYHQTSNQTYVNPPQLEHVSTVSSQPTSAPSSQQWRDVPNLEVRPSSNMSASGASHSSHCSGTPSAAATPEPDFAFQIKHTYNVLKGVFRWFEK